MPERTFEPALWVPPTPERELYDAYSYTVSTRFPAFGLREYDDVAADFIQPLLTYDSTEFIDDTLLSLILTEESFDAYCQDLRRHIEQYNLDSWLDFGSVVFATDHGQFTDVPVTAEALARIGFVERKKMVQVISMMIAVMTLDLGDGEFAVTDKLRGISNLLQTVPRLDGEPTDELVAFRRRRNGESSAALQKVCSTVGAVGVLSAIGRHNTTSKNGRTLYIHEPNRSTFGLLADSNTLVVPTYVHCPTFGPNGSIMPANLQSELFDPFEVTARRRQPTKTYPGQIARRSPKNSTEFVTALFRNATERTVGNQYRRGVRIKSWKAQQTQQKARQVVTHNNPDETTVDY